MKTNRRANARGFTLLEAMVVLVVIGVAAVISLDMLTSSARSEVRRSMISQQAVEMATISRAVTEWSTTATGLPTTTGQVMEVNLANVVTAGRLPSNFAVRPASGSSNPTSPLGQPYRAFVRRTATAVYEVVVVPIGSINAGFAARAGVQTAAESLRSWNAAVMQQLRERHMLPAGVITENTTAVNAAISGFDLNLDAFLGAAVQAPTVAAMGGFASLSSVVPSAQATPGSSNTPSECYHLDQNAPSLTCAAGYRPLWQYTLCSDVSGVSGRSINTPLGNYRISSSNAPTGPVTSFTGNVTQEIETNFPTYQGVMAPPVGSAFSPNCPGGTVSSDVASISGSWGSVTAWNLFCAGNGAWLAINYGTFGTFRSPPVSVNSWAAASVYEVPEGRGFDSVPSGEALGYVGYVTQGVGHRIVLGSIGLTQSGGILASGNVYGASTNSPNINWRNFDVSPAWTYVGERAPCAGSVNALPVHVFRAPTNRGGWAVAHSVMGGSTPVTGSSGTDSVITPSNGTITATCASLTLTNASTSGVTTNACPVVNGVRGLVTARGSTTPPRTVGVCCR